MKTRLEHFEEIRKKIDELHDDFPLDKSQWEDHTDLLSALMRHEQGYNRVEVVKGK